MSVVAGQEKGDDQKRFQASRRGKGLCQVRPSRQCSVSADMLADYRYRLLRFSMLA